MVRFAARGFTPIRHTFVQLKKGVGGQGSTLGDLVAARQGRALNAYLMLLLNSARIDRFRSSQQPPLDAAVWARALSPAAGTAEPWPPASMSRVWSSLEARGLIERERRWKRADVRAQHELGNTPYTRPRPSATGSLDPADEYFALPDEYWTDEWHARLTLAGRALLLIVLSSTSTRESMYLPYDRGPEWYGISRDTVRKGFHELADNGLVTIEDEVVADPWSGRGYATRYWYTPTGEFSTESRKARSANTSRETRARQKAANSSPKET